MYMLQKVRQYFIFIIWTMLEFMSQILHRLIFQLSSLILNMLAPCGTLVCLKYNLMKLNESRIIYPERIYTDALLNSGLNTLQSRRKISLAIYFGKSKTKIIFFTHFYTNEKAHLWLSETRILIKSQLPKFPDMDEGLYHIIFQKRF